MLARVKHLKKGDNVVARTGASAGKSGKVLEVKQAKALVRVDGVGVVKRHTKPSQQNPKGGIVEKLRWLPASIFQVCDASGKGLGRVGHDVAKDGAKTRVHRKKGSSKKVK